MKEPTAGQAPPLGERKKTHYLDDLRYWAEMCGAEISPDAGRLRSSDSRLALCATFAAQEAGKGREFMDAAYRARWAEVLDLSEPDVVRGLLATVGLDAGTALERARSAELEKRLDADTQDAIARGIFGLPTLLVGDRLLWGNDRFELARYFLQKEG